jgi:hypothetical protein
MRIRLMLTPRRTRCTETHRALKNFPVPRAYLYDERVKSMGKKNTLPAATGVLPEKEIARRLTKGKRQMRPVATNTK